MKSNDDRKSVRRKNLDHKKFNKKNFDEESFYQKKINKQFKQKKQSFLEEDDDWKNWNK